MSWWVPTCLTLSPWCHFHVTHHVILCPERCIVYVVYCWEFISLYINSYIKKKKKLEQKWKLPKSFTVQHVSCTGFRSWDYSAMKLILLGPRFQHFCRSLWRGFYSRKLIICINHYTTKWWMQLRFWFVL
jgi:hypothetical protein